MVAPFDLSLRRLTIIWLVTLVGVVLLAFSSNFIFDHVLSRGDAYSELINLAGRQRMLSQQIALHSALYVGADSNVARSTYARRLDQSLKTMQVEYRRLLESTALDPDLRDLYYADMIAPDSVIGTYWHSAELLMSLPAENISDSAPYMYILNNSQYVLTLMDGAMRGIIVDSAKSLASIRHLNNLRMLVIIVLLVGQIIFVLRPAVRRLRTRGIALEREIVERKRIEAELRSSETRFRLLVESAPVGIYESDSNGGITWVNDCWRQITGLSGAEANRSHWIDLIHPDDRDAIVETARQKRDAGEDILLDYRIVRPDGSLVYLHVSSRPVIDISGRLSGLLGTVMDMTQHKIAEERAIRLEGERQRIRVLGEFIRATSHDLRTPLSVIKSGLYLCGKLNDVERIHQKVEVIDQHVDYLTVVLEELQEMAILDSVADITLMPVAVGPMLRDIAHDFATRATENNKQLMVDIVDNLPTVSAAPDKLMQAFRAVIDNAFRYTADGGLITLNAASEGKFLVVTIADNGIGIAEEEQVRVFERFYKVDVARTVGAGAGLGLPIAKRVMELHGGKIDLSSALGEGTRVRLMLQSEVQAS